MALAGMTGEKLSSSTHDILILIGLVFKKEVKSKCTLTNIECLSWLNESKNTLSRNNEFTRVYININVLYININVL